jgi:UDP-N-acetylmuramoyl-tripeptide--D-alanyl-D-alanine ligase
VVGSLGKTTARHAVATALDCSDRHFSYSNYGFSLAENLLRVRPRDRFAVIEAGIAGPGRMASYGRMIRPDIVVVTSIKSEHNRSFATLQETRAEKVKMVRALAKSGTAILNGDDENVRWMATQTGARVLTFGLNSENAVRAEKVVFGEDGRASFEVRIGGKTFPVHSPLLGEHMIYPLLAALAVAHAENLDMAEVTARLARISPVTSRMELLALPNGIRILDDSFKSSQESIWAALDTFSKMSATRKVVVLGRIEEPIGKERDRYRELGARLAGLADLLVCVGDEDMKSVRAAAVRSGMDITKIEFAGSRIAGAANWLATRLRPGDLVLFKGASTQRLRRLVLPWLGKKVGCQVKYCGVKVRSCDDCPLLDAPEARFKNSLVRRYIKF